ncbi:MAG: hypothetical protein IID37_14550 [Planctomycetes bacterium]|nr:hypothetical protein [Planctomycetota bacterium]
MFQRATIIATIAMIMCVYVGTANGKAKKIKFFEPSQVQFDESVATLGEDADPDGMAILNYITPLDKTIVQIMVSDMTPNLTYSVQLTGCADPPSHSILWSPTRMETARSTRSTPATRVRVTWSSS